MLLALALAAALAQQPAAAPTAAQLEEQDTCMTCHADDSLSVDLPNGEKRSLRVDLDSFKASVHGRKLTCVDCHPEMKEVPHPERTFRSARDFSVAFYEQCKRCHFSEYTKTLDSVHYAAIARGDRMAPLCTDCHGAHEIRKPAQSRAQIVDTCAVCHAGVAVQYRKSVHGQALGGPNEADVPVCNDCHRTHDVAGPKEADWRLRTPQLCGSCHGDQNKMKKYGLSTAVVTTYVGDFHGKTASLRSAEKSLGAGAPFVALCTDCHGVHDIMKADAANSPVMQANLQQTCQRCHPGASKNFPAAWLSHYPPSLAKAPLVYGVKMFYMVFIPFMIVGLALQILLHLWRVVVNR
jgi:predicted CXXCH cytochrome family protein